MVSSALHSTGHRSNPQVQVGQHPEKLFEDNDYNDIEDENLFDDDKHHLFVDDNEEDDFEDDEDHSNSPRDQTYIHHQHHTRNKTK